MEKVVWALSPEMGYMSIPIWGGKIREYIASQTNPMTSLWQSDPDAQWKYPFRETRLSFSFYVEESLNMR